MDDLVSQSGWTIGQRVRAESEPTLGLGVVAAFPTTRSVTIHFPGAGETRTYNPQRAPLRRFVLAAGQTAHTRQGEVFRVERVDGSSEALLTYHGDGRQIPEGELADTMAANDPIERLFAEVPSNPDAFDLRAQAWRTRAAFTTPRWRGLSGARVSLLPHQLAIAHRVAQRERPRVLLADEVGLGKTIEAGLIYAALRSLGRAERVLVLAPASLVHQWLVEFYRRFGDLFTLAHLDRIDDATLKANAESGTRGGLDNPFARATRLVAPIDWLLEPGRLDQALEQPWDLVIIDEAHHLGWTPGAASPAYQAAEALAVHAEGLLLLTATPLRQGLATQFGLLRLVDPARYADFAGFEAEHAEMKEIADLARRLDAGEDVQAELRRRFPEANWAGDRQTQLAQLIDRHGTGRVLVRNRRDRLGGFPGRVLDLARLPRPDAWGSLTGGDWPEVRALKAWLANPQSGGAGEAEALDRLADEPAPPEEPPSAGMAALLWQLTQMPDPPAKGVEPPAEAAPTRETRSKGKRAATSKAEDLTAVDPRHAWVIDLVRGLGGAKVVIMAADIRTVRTLEARFRRDHAVPLAVFHEGLGLVERDRQAAYFADPEGARVLITSEIGGEGRNFQFCHHLALVDLPLHPDALEQRIGRLDRIGQTQPIQVHVAVVAGTPGEALFAWHQRLGVFDAPLTGGEAMLEAQAEALLAVLQAFAAPDETGRQAQLAAFLVDTDRHWQAFQAEVQAGIDYLVDLNSFDQPLGEALAAEISDYDPQPLKSTLSGLFDYFGVSEDDTADPRLTKISPGHHMKIEPFPGLRDDCLATFDRNLALAREDVQFLSPDHPLVTGAIGLLLDQAEGRASVGRWPHAPVQGVWIDFLFLLEAVAPERLGLARFLPPTPLTLTLDFYGGWQTWPETGVPRLKRLSPVLWERLAGLLEAELPKLLDRAQGRAEKILQPVVERAITLAATVLDAEHARLKALHVLGNVSPQELDAHARLVTETKRALAGAQVSLDAVRIVLRDAS